jgi:hypothetical protein
LAATNDLEEFIAANNLDTLPLATIYDTTQEESALFFLTGLATYNRKEAFGDGFHWWGSMAHDFFNSRREEVWTILQHTRPTWLGDWLMGGQGNSLADYRLLRDLEDAGFIDYRPQHFAFRFAWLALNQNPDKLTKRLIEDEKALTRDLPLQFEYEASIARLDGQSAANYQKFTWQRILLDLIKTGHLDRTDILTRCLLALRRDFRRPLLTWFKELFLALKPTVSERLARQADLVELLAHPLPLVVNFALEQLKNVWAEPGFNLAPLLLCADNLLARLDLKTGLCALLAGLAKLAKQQAARAPAVVRLLAAAIAHPDHSVQERAAKHLAELLQPKKLPLTAAAMAEAVAAIAGSAELLSTTARTLLAPWLGATAEQAPALSKATYLSISSFAPDISPATALAAVADWHELLFLTPEVLSQSNPLALERWLDGLLQLRSQLPADYSLQLQPYIKQLVPWLSSKSTLAEVLEHLAEWPPAWSRGLFEALLLSWYEGFASPRVSQVALGRQPIGEVGQAAYSSASDPLCYVNQQRLAFAEVLLANRVQLPLLSTFTHQPYYVSPVVLVEKLLRYQQHGTDPNLADLTIALARTAAHAPVAAAARQLLPSLAHQGLRALLDWYFSPDPAEDASPSVFLELPMAWPETLDAALPGLWAVAARTKFPAARLPWLATLEQAAETALAAATPPPFPPAWASPPESVARLHFMPPPRVISGLLVYAAHPVMRPRHGHGSEGWDGYASLRTVYAQLHALVPQHPAPLYGHTLRCATVTDNLEAASRELITSALYTLLNPGPVWQLAATQILASGLLHHHATCRSLGQEVLLRAVANGQLLPAALGQVLGHQLAVGYAPVPRLAASLATLGGIDALTDDALHQVLDALLPELPAAPLRNLRALLDLYADLRARTGRPTPAAVQARLGAWRTAPSLKKVASALAA